MDYETFILTEIESWGLERFRFHLSEPMIFVCGGILDYEPKFQAEADNCNKKFRSLRKYFCDNIFFINNTAIKTKILGNIYLAEEFTDYLQEGKYTNLIDFENDIAQISDVVAIFLESEGSLVEMGMFINIPALTNKVLVIAMEKYRNAPSFINHGPFTYLRNINDQAVTTYNWCNQLKNYSTDIVESIAEDIHNLLPKVLTEQFNKNNINHILFTIYEIIKLFYPITFNEIYEVIRVVVDDTDRKITKNRCYNLLYILKSMRHISIKNYSSYDYYYPIQNNKLKIHIKRKNKDYSPFDPNALHLRKIDFLKKNSERKRNVAFERIMETN